ncbi:hypothetical protein OUZ56_003170 [Daphnia magna]|uniref:Uncharacterized protein n=1 Tax=Daphnia magna TaxID=35525 RepID=A0ABR0A7Y5_9CRUS|nr:hypothetical protein OUZ56_003170 [Daphnia magna]
MDGRSRTFVRGGENSAFVALPYWPILIPAVGPSFKSMRPDQKVVHPNRLALSHSRAGAGGGGVGHPKRQIVFIRPVVVHPYDRSSGARVHPRCLYVGRHRKPQISKVKRTFIALRLQNRMAKGQGARDPGRAIPVTEGGSHSG